MVSSRTLAPSAWIAFRALDLHPCLPRERVIITGRSGLSTAWQDRFVRFTRATWPVAPDGARKQCPSHARLLAAPPGAVGSSADVRIGVPLGKGRELRGVALGSEEGNAGDSVQHHLVL